MLYVVAAFADTDSGCGGGGGGGGGGGREKRGRLSQDDHDDDDDILGGIFPASPPFPAPYSNSAGVKLKKSFRLPLSFLVASSSQHNTSQPFLELRYRRNGHFCILMYFYVEHKLYLCKASTVLRY